MAALQGIIAVITGGSTGIGLATAKRFVKSIRHLSSAAMPFGSGLW